MIKNNKEKKERAILFIIGLCLFVEGLIMSQGLLSNFNIDALFGCIAVFLGLWIIYISQVNEVNKK